MRFLLRHTTTYRYNRPVTLGRHRLMLRPRDSHEMKLHSATLGISPQPAQTVWHYDVFGNSVAIVEFDESVSELSIDSTLDVERFPFADADYLVAEHARTLPLAYSADEIRDLAGLQERHLPDPEHQIDLWAKSFLITPEGGSLPETLHVLNAMTVAIKDGFEYQARDAYGTQSPLQTLANRSGTCRDFAYLMMEGARSLGLAARFVSGYIYDSARDPNGDNTGTTTIGGGATHAWVQVYIPGAGWTHFDPTNALESDGELIPVAIVREPEQASPVGGSWEGAASDFQGMEVEVSVSLRQSDDDEARPVGAPESGGASAGTTSA